MGQDHSAASRIDGIAGRSAGVGPEEPRCSQNAVRKTAEEQIRQTTGRWRVYRPLQELTMKGTSSHVFEPSDTVALFEAVNCSWRAARLNAEHQSDQAHHPEFFGGGVSRRRTTARRHRDHRTMGRE